ATTRPGGRRNPTMKAGRTTKSRIHLEPQGDRWMLLVDDKPVICTHDRRWLLRFAVNLRKTLASDSPR
ncbi:MAG: hypothetical protein ABJF10_29465, partial [Chthoniobacter sp.]|uniref:hypothetical protein n=1 Tax=Chthoniobacter sp. TaxID=2510640 RepID=UPI0032AB485A